MNLKRMVTGVCISVVCAVALVFANGEVQKEKARLSGVEVMALGAIQPDFSRALRRNKKEWTEAGLGLWTKIENYEFLVFSSTDNTRIVAIPAPVEGHVAADGETEYLVSNGNYEILDVRRP